jgi:hypothetical protein
MTKQEILNSNDFSGKLTLPYGFELYTLYPGGDKLHYYFFDRDNLLFSGKNYRPSPLYPSIDCLASVIGCLSFLTLQDGATDREYFADYTPAQIRFRDSFECEALNLLVLNFEDETLEQHADAVAYFTRNYTQEITA